MAQPTRLKLTDEDLENAERIQDVLKCRGISTPVSVGLSMAAMLLEARAAGSEIRLRSPDGIFSSVTVEINGEKIVCRL